MPFTCCVPGCNSQKSVSVFSIPNDKKRKCDWENAIGIKTKKSHRVCEKHFLSESIIRFAEYKDQQGNLIATVSTCLKMEETKIIDIFKMKISFLDSIKDSTIEIRRLAMFILKK